MKKDLRKFHFDSDEDEDIDEYSATSKSSKTARIASPGHSDNTTVLASPNIDQEQTTDFSDTNVKKPFAAGTSSGLAKRSPENFASELPDASTSDCPEIAAQATSDFEQERELSPINRRRDSNLEVMMNRIEANDSFGDSLGVGIRSLPKSFSMKRKSDDNSNSSSKSDRKGKETTTESKPRQPKKPSEKAEARKQELKRQRQADLEERRLQAEQSEGFVKASSMASEGCSDDQKTNKTGQIPSFSKQQVKPDSTTASSSYKTGPTPPTAAASCSDEDKLLQMIESEIISTNLGVTWEDVAGLDSVRDTIEECVMWPILRPDLFSGPLLSQPKGILLFGPPGTGKTMIGRCIASQCEATFFNISAASLLSKWVGESERLMRVLFTTARNRQPSIIFIDEVDALLSARAGNSSEHESSRRMKTEFLVQFDGMTSTAADRVVVIGATNRPADLDEAVRRRFSQRVYVPLPILSARTQLFGKLLGSQAVEDSALERVAVKTEGYSCADITSVCREAAMMRMRTLRGAIRSIAVTEIPPLTVEHLEAAINRVRPSIDPASLASYSLFEKQFGTSASL